MVDHLEISGIGIKLEMEWFNILILNMKKLNNRMLSNFNLKFIPILLRFQLSFVFHHFDMWGYSK